MPKDHNIGYKFRTWEKLAELTVHHDNLKQQRIRHFITVQIALAGAFIFVLFQSNILEKTNNGSQTPAFVTLIAISAFAATYSSIVALIDRRAANYTRTVKRHTAKIEKVIRHVSKKSKKRPLHGIRRMPFEQQRKELDCGIKAATFEQILIWLIFFNWLAFAIGTGVFLLKQPARLLALRHLKSLSQFKRTRIDLTWALCTATPLRHPRQAAALLVCATARCAT